VRFGYSYCPEKGSFTNDYRNQRYARKTCREILTESQQPAGRGGPVLTQAAEGGFE
jgi:hypothetical protein